LRFENLSSDSSIDWMGRAFSEILVRELAAVPGFYAMGWDRLHNSDGAFGPRPPSTPGISAERGLALAAGADRLAYGEYSLRAGKIETRITLEDTRDATFTQVLSASAPSPVEAAGLLAKQISSQAAGYPTGSVPAIRAYVSGLEANDLPAAMDRMQESIAADPNFAPPYLLLAVLKLRQRDQQGAISILDQAASHGSAMPELERARMAYERAQLRNNTVEAENAVVQWARQTPNDPAVWRIVGQSLMAHQQYSQAVQAYQKAIDVEPNSADLLNQLGYAAAFNGDLAGAKRAFERYQTLRPADVNALDSLGDVHLLLGRLSEAENYYMQSTKREPTFLNGGDFFKAAMTRLMTGDLTGSDALHEKFLDVWTKGKDALVEPERAQWEWTTGRRKQARDRMLAFARAGEPGPLRPAASEAYSILAVWDLALGDRTAAATMTQKALQTATPASVGAVAIARFLVQPPASPAEWQLRAQHDFPAGVPPAFSQNALAYALLLDKHFDAASLVLKPLYDTTPPTSDNSFGILLAWTYLETGKAKEAAALLRFNPIPAATGSRSSSFFYFPRLFYLRGRVAQLAGDRQQAATQFKIFRQLSGDLPLVWGEEEKAK
jgi:tetratricopeptide (TPR) repeat protein